MSKPLTIDELKALQIGDWVWFLHNQVKPCYGTIIGKHDDTIYFNTTEGLQRVHWKNYGKTWVVYKNKEQAESESEWVELPRIEPFSTSNFFTQEPVTAYNILYRDKESGELIIDCEVDKAEAEALLEELRGRK